jgi:hypothetical protein
MSLVVGALTKLGERYPAALGELRERMENARRRVLGHADDMEPLREIAAIARALKDEQAMVALYDAIPVGDVRRQRAAIYAVDGLVAAQRYGDALVGRPYGTMVSNFESNLPFLSAPTPAATRGGKWGKPPELCDLLGGEEHRSAGRCGEFGARARAGRAIARSR